MIEEDDDIQQYVRPWVNFTNQEMIEAWHGTPIEDEWIDRVWAFAEALQKILKEKNT